MVRTIVGTLLDVGLGRKTPEDMDLIIESRSRLKAGKASPAKGLFLSRVVYSTEIYLD
jgi:tRNA pseudouridine38-40 synthase